MKQMFPHVLLRVSERPESPDIEIRHPPGWSLEFALEVDLALDVIARAFHNQGIISGLFILGMHLNNFKFQPTGMCGGMPIILD
jgi:hypothetical protein